MAFKVYPYKQGSRSAKELANLLGGKVLKLQGSKFRPKAGDTVVNWGSGKVPEFSPATILNGDVSSAANKKTSFIKMHQNDVRVPDFVTAGQDRVEGRTVKQAASELGFPVVCRTKLTGHSGEGIVIANTPEELVDAPLYTKYIKKQDEYRVHVIRNPNAEHDYHPFFIQRKARKLDVADPNWQVRNLAGGFVFVETAINEVPQDVLDQAENAVEALGLDFGGVDVIWNQKERKAYVLEINTACGLEERTAARYAEEILNTVENR